MTLVNMKSVVALFIKSKEQPSVKMSPELRKNIYYPEAKSTALFIALYIPLSGSDIQNVILDAYLRMISILLSVEAPSMTIYSKFEYFSEITLLIVCSNPIALFLLIVMIDNFIDNRFVSVDRLFFYNYLIMSFLCR